ncbi:hypothetical protein D3C81_1964330 [compost metagenome]
MADGDTQPSDEAAHAGSVKQPVINHAVAEQRGEESDHADERCHEERVHRNTAGVQSRQELWSFPAQGQGIQHPRGGIHPGVAGRQHG